MSSVNSGMKAARPAKGAPRMAPLLIFDELTRGESYLYVRQCTAVNAGALLLVASNLDPSRALRLAITSLSLVRRTRAFLCCVQRMLRK